jgi:hypothetical protein
MNKDFVDEKLEVIKDFCQKNKKKLVLGGIVLFFFMCLFIYNNEKNDEIRSLEWQVELQKQEVIRKEWEMSNLEQKGEMAVKHFYNDDKGLKLFVEMATCVEKADEFIKLNNPFLSFEQTKNKCDEITLKIREHQKETGRRNPLSEIVIDSFYRKVYNIIEKK